MAHYFRSGDFILALLRGSSNLNEYAFALGALSHYAADNDGHRFATNQVVPLLYPELRKKFGPVVTLRFRHLSFTVEGAAVDLAGTYALRHGDLDLAGHLSLQAKLSQMVTGAKSLFLKPMDPFFEKNGSGTVLPIHITGTRENPVFAVTVFHKTFDKHLGVQKSKLL